MITNMRDFITSLMKANISCNWPGTMDDCFEMDVNTGQRKLTARFEKHASTYENWSVGRSFFDIFPELVGQIRIQEAVDP